MPKPFQPDPKYWKRRERRGALLYSCLVCQDPRERTAGNCRSHENTQSHQQNLLRFQNEPSTFAAAPVPEPSQTPSPDSSIPRTDHQAFHAENPILQALVRSITAKPNQLQDSDFPGLLPNEPNPTGSYSTHSEIMTPDPTGLHWDVEESLQLDDDPWKDAASRVAQATLDFLNGDLSDGEENERSDVTDNEHVSTRIADSDSNTDDELNDQIEDRPEKRPRNHTTDSATARHWYPWQDRITCTLDILMHLPRSVFSVKQLDLFLWLLRVNNVDYVPGVDGMKDLNKLLQHVCGIDTVGYDGILGHRYYVNNLGQILAQELSNPQVRPHMHFYPEDSGDSLAEARQAGKWLHELSSQDTTPMIRHKAEDYYIHEPVVLTNGNACIPTRWFTRRGIFYAKAWPMEQICIDGNQGWCVREDLTIEVSEKQLLKNFLGFMKDHTFYNMPHPSKLFGVRKDPNDAGGTLSAWVHTDPSIGNRWRVLAHGRRVAALPLWMYCDDTSGNTSKKWNKHNSFLFTLAGLPREQAAKEYNVHFLCTSNKAPPLEMLDGVLDQLEKARVEGVWAWDCENNEPILVFPVILALLGDNPMQSEFACHIGMRGKLFCRACWVKGTDAADVTNPFEGNDGGGSDADSVRSSDGQSSGGEESDGSDVSGSMHEPNTDVPILNPVAPKKKKGKFVESMASMVKRVSSFVKVGKLRRKPETKETLQMYFEKATVVGNKTALKNLRTEKGVKDTIQEFFLDKLYNLTEVQISNIHALYHLITSVGEGVNVCDGSVRILTQALQYQSENRLLLAISGLNGHSSSPDVSQGEIRGVFEDLQIRLEENFTLTKEQQKNIRKLSQELVYQPSRTGFKRLHLDVESKIRNKPETYRMVNVFGQPARETAFLSAVKRIASGVRNSFRQDIRDSILSGPGQSSLEEFTVNTMHKYRPASLSETINKGSDNLDIQRQFALENLDLLGVAEDELEDQEGSDVGNPPATGQKRKRINRGGKGGRIPNGEDFWSRVDAWFSEEMAKHDNDLTGLLWKPYVEETLRLDNQKFNPTFAPNSSPRVATSSMVSGQSGSIGATPSTTVTVTANSSGPQTQPSAADALLNALRRGGRQ